MNAVADPGMGGPGYSNNGPGKNGPGKKVQLKMSLQINSSVAY